MNLHPAERAATVCIANGGTLADVAAAIGGTERYAGLVVRSAARRVAAKSAPQLVARALTTGEIPFDAIKGATIVLPPPAEPPAEADELMDVPEPEMSPLQRFYGYRNFAEEESEQ